MSRRKIGLTSTLLMMAATVIGLVILDNHEAQAVPDPVTCEGYPEKRVFMENQSWVEPQPGDPAHPGFGKQGHIHMSTCFPLMQTLTGDPGDTLDLDVRFQLHNVTGQPNYVTARLYQLLGPAVVIQPSPMPACLVADCEQWVHMEVPLDQTSLSGWVNLQIFMNVLVSGTPGSPSRVDWYNLNRWFFYLDNDKPLRTPTPQEPRIGGDTWLSGPGTNYSEVVFTTADFPWDFDTGEMIPISGTWTPQVRFMRVGPNVAMVDPALHANPPVFNYIYQGTGVGFQTLSIDTTLLSNGIHRLLVSSCNPTAQGGNYTNCGVLVVRFLVDNFIPPDVVLTPGQSYIVDCPTTLTGTIGANRAELTCAD